LTITAGALAAAAAKIEPSNSATGDVRSLRLCKSDIEAMALG
jgi:hypothetical protein